MNESQQAAQNNRLRAMDLGLSRIRNHLVAILAENERALWMVERNRKLVREVLAQIELDTPRAKRRKIGGDA